MGSKMECKMSDIDKQIQQILRDFDNAASIYTIEVKVRYETANAQIKELIAQQVKEARIDELDLILDKLPLQVDGHRLQIWRENDNLSWDIAYNTDTGNLKPIVWEQARHLSEAVDQMLKRLKGDDK